MPAVNLYLPEKVYIKFVYAALKQQRKVTELLQEAAEEYAKKLST
jgi:hypothetical protein